MKGDWRERGLGVLLFYAPSHSHSHLCSVRRPVRSARCGMNASCARARTQLLPLPLCAAAAGPSDAATESTNVSKVKFVLLLRPSDVVVGLSGDIATLAHL